MENINKKANEVEITTKTDREHVILRPGMYLESILYLILELVDNAIDEFVEGFGNLIRVKLYEEKDEETGEHKKTIIVVQDTARGLPVAPCKDNPEISQAERAMSSLRAGGKFGDNGNYSSKTGGLNGVGAAAVNFVSKKFDILIKKKDKTYGLTFENGICTNHLFEYEGPTPGFKDDDTGTLITQEVNEEIWADKEDFDIDSLISRLRAASFLNPGLKVELSIDYKGRKFEDTFYSEKGLEDYLNFISQGEDLTDVYHNSISKENIDIDFAFKYTEYEGSAENAILGFTNNIENKHGGSHILGFKEAINNSLKEYYLNEMNNKVLNFEPDDTRDGIFAIVSVKVNNPNFEGQGKTKVNMPFVRREVREFVASSFSEILDKDPNVAKQIINKVLESARVRESAKRAREVSKKSKSILGTSTVKGLTKCNSNKPEECELFLVEGDSAGGSAKQGRDKNIQAILPVFGKINNTADSKLNSVINHSKIMEAVKALGCGIGKEFNIENLRYDKIVILSDGDVDGLHIQNLWMTFFYMHLRPLVDEGHLYLACPPLYSIIHGKDKKRVYLYTEEEKVAYTKEHTGEKMNITRYKGLGEMNPSELWTSTMDPETREIIRLTSDQIAESLDMINTWMGEDTAGRKEIILNNLDEDIKIFG